MSAEATTTLVLSVLLLLANAFFVAAEYGLVSARRSKVEALAKKGNRRARAVMKAYDELSTFVAGVQVCITVVGIGIGALTEPALSKALEPMLGFLPDWLLTLVSVFLVAYPLVVLGELLPKYVTLQHPERIALATVGPQRVINTILMPLVWLIRKTGEGIVRLVGVRPEDAEGQGLSREELALLLRSSSEDGHFDEAQASVVNKALNLDRLDASDVLIHRLDIKWVDLSLDRAGLLAALKTIPHSRIPVCDGDIDEVVGVAYLQDIVRHLDEPGFSLGAIMRPAEFVPENLSLDKVVTRMRDTRTQILFVRDEYGGTSGLLTLEDVVEEVFGELEDSLESERPQIERTNPRRVTARADVRYDELLQFLRRDDDEGPFTTETLAEIVIDALGRVPRVGDSVDVPLGTLKVENMARRRVTRIALVESPPRVES